MTEELKAGESWLAILFADISDSTRLYTTYGDVEARRIVSACLACMTEIVRDNRGRVIKTIGDELMCMFPDADAAATAAIQMQSAVQEKSRSGALHAGLSLRAGFHGGPVLEEKGDVFGDAVNLAARMAGLSKAHQVLTTRQMADRLGPALRSLARFMDQSVIKGQSGEFDLYELVWDTEEATMAATRAVRPVVDASVRLQLTLRNRSWTVDRQQPSLTLGRNRQCDVVIEDSMISRLHAKVEYHKGKFFLSDVSTNGTYIVNEQGQKQYARRDQVPLEGHGIICLGREPDPKAEVVLRYAHYAGAAAP